MKRIIRYASIYFENASVRFNVSSLISLLLNAFYIVFNFIFGIVYGDAWLIAVGAYYSLLFSIRVLVIREGGNKDTEKTAALLMTALGVPITGMIIYRVIVGGEVAEGFFVSAVFFVYTVYSALRAVSGIKKSKGNNGSNQSVLHTIRLSAALMSIFNFQEATEYRQRLVA